MIYLGAPWLAFCKNVDSKFWVTQFSVVRQAVNIYLCVYIKNLGIFYHGQLQKDLWFVGNYEGICISVIFLSWLFSDGERNASVMSSE